MASRRRALSVLLLAGNVAFTIASAAISLRLLLMWRRTRELPELCIAMSFLTGGVLTHTWTWLLVITGTGTSWGLSSPMEEITLAVVVFRTLYAGGTVWILLAAWRIFRPRHVGATLLVGSLLPIYLYTIFWEEISGVIPISEWIYQPTFWLSAASSFAPWLWMCWETIARVRSGRQRRRLGLPSSSLLEYRMLMWSIGSASIALLHLSYTVGIPLYYFLDFSFPAMTTSVLGVVCAAAFWLAFFPPSFLHRRLSGEGG